jgi:PAS domain S-box-containing protein
MQASEIYFNLFQHNTIPCLILNTDAPKFTIKAVNKAYLKLNGAVEENILGKSIFEAFLDHPQQDNSEKSNLLASLIKALESRLIDIMPIKRFEIKQVTLNTSEEQYSQYENIPVLNKEEEVTDILHIIHDLTENTLVRKTLATLKKEIENQSEILRQSEITSKQGTWEYDLKTEKWHWSAGLYHMLGIQANEIEITFDKILSLIHPEDRELAGYSLEQSITKGADYKLNKMMITKSGEIIYVKAKGFLLYDVEGKATKLVGVIQDITDETIALNELTSTKDELNKMMDNSLDIICSMDENGYFVKVSKASFDVLGYHPHEMIHKKFIDFVTPKDVAKTLKSTLEVTKGLKMTNFENRYMHKNGSLVPIIWSAIWNEKEKLFFCNAKDATKLRLQEKALLDSEKKYKMFFEENPSPMFLWDLETFQIIDCNKEALIKYGYSRAEFLKLTIKDIRPTEDIHLVDTAAQSKNIFASNQITNWRHQKKNGEIMFMKIQGHIIDYKGRRTVLVILNDITNKLKAQELLQENEKKYRSVIESNMDGILVLGIDGRVYSANSAALDIFQLTEEELIHQNFTNFMDLTDARLKPLLLERDLKGKARGELIFIKKDGSKFPGEATSVLIDNTPNHEITCLVIRDITKRTTYINAIEDQNKKLQNIAYVQSHIVRAPLARMMGIVSLIKELKLGNEEANMLIKYFEQSSWEFDQIIKDIVLQAAEHTKS